MTSSPPTEEVACFHIKGVRDHLRDIASDLNGMGKVFLASFAALWTGVAACTYAMALDFRGGRVLSATILLSYSIAVILSGFRYLRRTPSGFERESRTAQRLAHLQRPYWEYRLGEQLLREKLLPLDMIHSDLLEGFSFVPPERELGFQEYVAWASMRNKGIARMLNVALATMPLLPNAISSTEGVSTDPTTILRSVDRIAALYRASIEFERQHLAILPPEEFEKLHGLLQGSTEPIRKGIRELFRFFDDAQSLLAVRRTQDDRLTIQFTVTFESHNISAISSEFERVVARVASSVHEDAS